MCPATTHVEKVVAVIITTLTQNIVQHMTVGLEQSLVLLAKKQLPVGGASQTLHTLTTGTDKGNLLPLSNAQNMQLVILCNSLIPRQPGYEVHYKLCQTSYQSPLFPIQRPSYCSSSSDTDKAGLLNEYFTSCFNPAVQLPSYSELPQCIEGDVEGYDITQDEVYMRLRMIKPHSAAGPDGITSWMLSTFADVISPSLASLNNLLHRTDPD